MMISLINLGKVNWKPSGQDSPFQKPWTLVIQEVKTSVLRVWKFILALMNDFEGFKISVEEVTADVEIGRELEIRSGTLRYNWIAAISW